MFFCDCGSKPTTFKQRIRLHNDHFHFTSLIITITNKTVVVRVAHVFLQISRSSCSFHVCECVREGVCVCVRADVRAVV